ncbi:MAG: HWE histidine kinase domain-containing protein [Pirellulales bacterium]
MGFEDVALANCDQEPVHIPGRIQSFGTLIAMDAQTELVSYAAANWEEVFPAARGCPVGKHLHDVFADRTFVHDLRGALGLATLGMHRERMGAYEVSGAMVDVAVHRQREQAVVELEPLTEPDGRSDATITRVRSMLDSVRAMTAVDDGLSLAVDSLRRLTGFDRVMGYRFLPNGDGEVLAEARSPGIEPFLGLRYPAWDIPAQVREIALRMPFRLIADVNDPHVALAATAGAPPLDLTFAHLRGVSPVHLEYLRNMGVGASMNCSIIVQGALWGLFAFHHYRAKVLPPNCRSICEMFSQFYSCHLEQQLEREMAARSKRARAMLASFESADQCSLTERFDDLAPELAQALEVDGLAIAGAAGVKAFGHVPTHEAILAIGRLATDELLGVNHLSASGIAADGLDGVAGAIIVPFADEDLSRLFFFRDEMITSIRWAGTREKTISHGPLGPRLHPRSSFEEYKESVHGRSREWTRADMAAAGEVRTLVLEALNRNLSTSDREWRKQRRQQDLLIAELNHRVKNILALVRSIARQTKDSAETVEEYAEAFERRIAALAFAHDLVGGRGTQQASLAELVQMELRPYASGFERACVSGPSMALRPEAAPILALVFHELVSNAAKYGALAGDDGKLRVAWKEEKGGLTIEWDEEVTRLVTPPTRRGFGTALIERAIPFECRGESRVQYRADGLSVRMWLPREMLTRYEPVPMVETSRRESAAPRQETRFGKALVAEDNMILTMELEGLLAAIGFDGVDSAPNNSQSWELLAAQAYDVAILDVNLAGQTTFELAEFALQRNVPVIFVTGYGTHVDMPESLAGAPRLSKPIDRDMLVATLHELKVGRCA